MGKQRKGNKKQRDKQAQAMGAMDTEGGGGGEWTTAPASAAAADDFIGMDTGEAGVQPRQPGEKVNLKRGKSSSKQKERKRKSLEKALAVASQAETKVTKTAAREGSKKSLKKLWQNSREDKD